jgi:hypothetical protein
MNRPQTIQIFLPDGDPRGVKIADITSRTVEALLIPRSQLDKGLKRKEINKVGVYFFLVRMMKNGKNNTEGGLNGTL